MDGRLANCLDSPGASICGPLIPYDAPSWQRASGTTFNHDTDYFGREAQQLILNFRVNDLAAMVAQPQEAGIEVNVDPETYLTGNFARLHDPEGNPIELWQPK
jgi:glyoxylase I family protein